MGFRASVFWRSGLPRLPTPQVPSVTPEMTIIIRENKGSTKGHLGGVLGRVQCSGFCRAWWFRSEGLRGMFCKCDGDLCSMLHFTLGSCAGQAN